MGSVVVDGHDGSVAGTPVVVKAVAHVIVARKAGVVGIYSVIHIAGDRDTNWVVPKGCGIDMAAAPGAACMPLPALPSRKIEYLEAVGPNYRAWREALIQTAKQGYKIRWAELERPIGGYRRARVHVTDKTGNDATLSWLQPWRGNRVDE